MNSSTPGIPEFKVDFPDIGKNFTEFEIDDTWVSEAFLIGKEDFEDPDVATNMYFSSASRKWTDTRIGGSIGVGARPQACQYSDIPDPGVGEFRNKLGIEMVNGNYGMGRDYSTRIDDTDRIVFVRFGVPQFNSITRFFILAFDPNITSMVNTGRPKGWMYTIGEVIGTIVFVSAFPVGTLVLIGMRLISSYFTQPSSRYYSLKPTMYMYWSAVESLLNHLAINRGLYPRNATHGNETTGDQTVNTRQSIDKETLDVLVSMMPDVFTEDYGITVFGVITRAQRTFNAIQTQIYDRSSKASDTEYDGIIKKRYLERVRHSPNDFSLAKWLSEHVKLSYYLDSDKESEADVRIDRTSNQPIRKVPDSFQAYYDAEFSLGAEFAAFRVDQTGSSTVSFTNNVKDTDLAVKLNGLSADARELKFSFAGGNIFDNPIGNAFETVAAAAKDVVVGGLNLATFGLGNAVIGLAGGGYVDIPKHWDSSTVQLPTLTYSRTLVAPYNNVISILQNIDFYVCMAMAMVAPLSTGKQSYGSPFLCQWWDRGRNQASLGICKECTIERGVGNLPFDMYGAALAVKVSFTFLDLSSIMSMPISSGTLFNTLRPDQPDMGIDEDNILKDYLAVMAGMDIKHQFYKTSKAQLSRARKARKWALATSPARWAAITHDSLMHTPFGWFGDAASGYNSAIEQSR